MIYINGHIDVLRTIIRACPSRIGEQWNEPPKPKREPKPMEEALGVIEDYANDLRHTIKMFGTDCNCARCGQAPVINAPDMAHNDGPGHVSATGAVFTS